MLTTANKPVPVLLHETDAGLPCLVCQEDCPGLEIHFWRKICINCKCSVSDHQPPSTAQQITQAKRGKQLDDNVRAQFECGKYSWIPAGLSPSMVEEYMGQLPPEQRTLIGSVGEQYRRKLLMTQLPSHDHTPSETLSTAQAEELAEFSRVRYEMSHGVGYVRAISGQEADMFDCRTCQSPLCESQLGVFTERAGAACIWCVTCFKCDVCTEPLVDLHYFYKDGELFCGRHHAELLKPRCNACDELILAKEYTLAEEHNWHIDHFCCWECDSPLGGQRYVTRDDHPFCILCYEELFAPPCKKCMVPIGLDSAHMVHRNNHWHATESCFFCENCQVSLTTSPFLFKFDEIFCSSACAQQYSVLQLSDYSPTNQPQIEVIEDNPVDRTRVTSILRKESTPTPPSQNGVSKPRKVMFDVSQDPDPDTDTEESDSGKRTFSEEEFEYLEKSLIENQFIDDHISPSKISSCLNVSSGSTDLEESEDLEELEDLEESEDLDESEEPKEEPEELVETKDYPCSESSLSNSPLSESDLPLFDTPEPEEPHTDIIVSQPGSEESLEEPEAKILDSSELSYQGIGPSDQGAELSDQGAELTDQGAELAEQGAELSEQGAELSDQGVVIVILDVDVSMEDEEDEEVCQLEEVDDDSKCHEFAGIVMETEDRVSTPDDISPQSKSPKFVINEEDTITSPIAITLSFEDKSPSDHVTSLSNHDTSPSDNGTIPGEILPQDASPDRKAIWDADEKENEFRPRPNRRLSETDREDDGAVARKLSRNKLSSASFSRVLRKIDPTESLFVERPGKRLNSRPRSMSSLNSHNRPQNTLEQKDDLISMYALAPDIADMIASVYQNQNSINTTTQSHPDRDESRTLGASPSPCLTETPRLGTLRRNPSYEAAEFVMQLDVESGEDQQEKEDSVKKIEFSPVDSTRTTEPPVKSPKKGIKQRLSFKKKKKEKNSSPEKNMLSSPKGTVSSPTGKSAPTKANNSIPTDNISPPKNISSPEKVVGDEKKRTKKACVVM